MEDKTKEELMNELAILRRELAELKDAEKRFKECEKEGIRQERKFSENLINSSVDGILAYDRDCRYTIWNPGMERISGVKKEEAIGRVAFEVFPFLKKIGEDKFFFDALAGKTVIAKERPYEVPKTGRHGFFEGHYSPLRDETGNIVGGFAIIRDITDRKLQDSEIEMLNKELLRSNKRLKQISLRDSQTGLYNYRYLAKIIGSEFSHAKRYLHPLSVIMLDIDYFKSINDVYGHQFGDIVLNQLSRQLKRMVHRYDIVIRFGGDEFVILCSEIDRVRILNLSQKILEAIRTYQFGNKEHSIKLKLSMAVASYPEDNTAKGMDLINIADRILDKAKAEGGDRIYSSLDLGKKRYILKVNNDETVEIKYLKDKIEKLTKRGHQSLIESIFAFARTIELKDHYTGEHTERTVYYATEIANALHLAKEEIEPISEAAILHDLGKVGISEKILHKKAKLTKAEFRIIRRHPQIAADILRPIRFMHDIIPLILYHHERWDGKGYPTGLKGEEIPIGGRIIAIADVYQALTSDRPYRKAYPKKKALKIIKDGSGKQFDPKIVSVFLDILKKEK